MVLWYCGIFYFVGLFGYWIWYYCWLIWWKIWFGLDLLFNVMKCYIKYWKSWIVECNSFFIFGCVGVVLLDVMWYCFIIVLIVWVRWFYSWWRIIRVMCNVMVILFMLCWNFKGLCWLVVWFIVVVNLRMFWLLLLNRKSNNELRLLLWFSILNGFIKLKLILKCCWIKSVKWFDKKKLNWFWLNLNIGLKNNSLVYCWSYCLVK